MPCVELHSVSPSGRQSATAQCGSIELWSWAGARYSAGDRQLGRGQRRLGVAALVLDRVVLEGLVLERLRPGRRRSRAAPTAGRAPPWPRPPPRGVSAATAATAAPRVAAAPRAAPSRRRTAGQSPGPITARTPGTARAASSDIDVRRALACGLRSTVASSWRGSAHVGRVAGRARTGGRRRSGGWSARRPRRAADRPATPGSESSSTSVQRTSDAALDHRLGLDQAGH